MAEDLFVVGASNGMSNWIGDLAELVVLRGVPSEAERAAYEKCLGARYGIPVN
jgi:hypothetical protein